MTYQPGFELDCIVAEAMGWTQYHHPEFYPEPYWEDSNGRYHEFLPEFSTDPAYVGPMCEWLRQGCPIRITIDMESASVIAVDPISFKPKGIWTTEKLPHALALAIAATRKER